MVRKNTISKKTHKRKNGRKTMKGGFFFGSKCKTKMSIYKQKQVQDDDGFLSNKKCNEIMENLSGEAIKRITNKEFVKSVADKANHFFILKGVAGEKHDLSIVDKAKNDSKGDSRWRVYEDKNFSWDTIKNFDVDKHQEQAQGRWLEGIMTIYYMVIEELKKENLELSKDIKTIDNMIGNILVNAEYVPEVWEKFKKDGGILPDEEEVPEPTEKAPKEAEHTEKAPEEEEEKAPTEEEAQAGGKKKSRRKSKKKSKKTRRN